MIIGGLGRDMDVGMGVIALVKLKDEASSGGGCCLYAAMLVSPVDSTKVLL